MKRCIAQYALNLFCITEQGEHIRKGGGCVKKQCGEYERNVWEERRMSGGFSHFLQCCALKVGQRERERETP